MRCPPVRRGQRRHGPDPLQAPGPGQWRAHCARWRPTGIGPLEIAALLGVSDGRTRRALLGGYQVDFGRRIGWPVPSVTRLWRGALEGGQVEPDPHLAPRRLRLRSHWNLRPVLSRRLSTTSSGCPSGDARRLCPLGHRGLLGPGLPRPRLRREGPPRAGAEAQDGSSIIWRVLWER